MARNYIKGCNEYTESNPLTASKSIDTAALERGKTYFLSYNATESEDFCSLSLAKGAFLANKAGVKRLNVFVNRTYAVNSTDYDYITEQGADYNYASLKVANACHIVAGRSYELFIGGNVYDAKVQFYNASGTLISEGAWFRDASQVFTAPENCSYCLFVLEAEDRDITTDDFGEQDVYLEAKGAIVGVYDIMLNVGSAREDYEEYREPFDGQYRNLNTEGLYETEETGVKPLQGVGYGAFNVVAGRDYVLTYETDAFDGHGEGSAPFIAIELNDGQDEVASQRAGGAAGRTLTFRAANSLNGCEARFHVYDGNGTELADNAHNVKVWGIQLVEGTTPYEYMPNLDRMTEETGFIRICNSDHRPFLEVPITANAKHVEELMKKDSVELQWNDVYCYEIPVGSYVEWKGIFYYLDRDYVPESKELGKYEYKPEFRQEVYLLDKMPFMLTSTIEETVEQVTTTRLLRESDWNFTGAFGDLKTTLEAAILAAIGVEYTIVVDEQLTKALQVSFSNVSILSALNTIAQNFDQCEWWVEPSLHEIHFAPYCVKSVSDPLTLTAGEEVGYPSSNNKTEYYNRFYVFGSTRNIPQDYSGAMANTIVKKRLTLDPTLHPEGYIDLPQFDEDGNVLVTHSGNSRYRFYDENGVVQYYVPDGSVKSGRVFTKVLHLDEIYPRADLKVRSIQTVQRYVRDNEEKPVVLADGTHSIYYLYFLLLEDGDGNIFSINNKTYSKDQPNGSLIKGETLSLHFKTGALTGREFQCHHYEETDDRHKRDETTEAEGGRRDPIEVAVDSFEIIKTEDNTIVIPNTGIAPQVGDEVIVFNCRMPQEYVTKGYKDLDKEAMRQIWELTKDGNMYTVKSNQIWFHDNEPDTRLGRKVAFYLGGRKIDTRITKLTTALDREFEQEIAFSKAIQKGTINTLLTQVEVNDQRIMAVKEEDDTNVKMAKKQLYEAQRELKESMFDTDGYFTAPISPTTVETMLVQVGAKSQNFTLSNVKITPNYSATAGQTDYTKVLVDSSNGKLTHFGIDDTEVKEWNVSSSTINNLTNTTGAYYVYAKCIKSGTTCTIVVTQTQWRFDGTSLNSGVNDDTNYYYFLVGTLSSRLNYAAPGQTAIYRRELNLTYGQTTITGNNIKTGRIQSVDGNTYFDLDKGEIGGKIDFTSTGIQAAIEGVVDDATAAAESAAQTAVANLSIGTGRNYLLKTGTPATLTFSGSSQQTYHPYASKQENEAIQSGVDVVFSCDYEVALTSGEVVMAVNSMWRGLKTFNSETENGHLSVAFKTTKKITYTSPVYLQGTAVGSITLRNCKWELGVSETDWSPAPEDLIDAADAAAAAAAAAQTSANAANATLNDYADDSKVSPQEKSALANQWEDIKSEYGSIIAEAQKYSLQSSAAYTGYVTAKTNADNAFNYFLNPEIWGQFIDISSGTTGATKWGYFKAYYDARQNLLNAIATAAQALAQEALTTAQNISVGGRNYFGKFNLNATWLNFVWESDGRVHQTDTTVADTRSWNYSESQHKTTTKLPAGEYMLTVWCITANTRSSDNICLRTSTDGTTDGQSAATWVQSGILTAGEKYTKKITLASDLYVGVEVKSDGVYRIQLEDGNVSTAWKMATEDLSAGIDAAKQIAQGAQAAIDAINSDTTFSLAEKKAFRPTWYAISGTESTSTAFTASSTGSGSFHNVRDAAKGVGLSVTNLVTWGNDLRTFLNTYKLAVDEDTTSENFNPSRLSELLKIYLNEEERLWKAINDLVTAYYSRNLLRLLPGMWENGSFDDYGNETNVATRIRTDYYVPVKANVTYKITNYTNSSFHWYLMFFANSDGTGFSSANSINSAWQTARTVTYTPTAAGYVRLSVRNEANTTAIDQSAVDKLQMKFEEGSEATAFSLAPEDVAALNVVGGGNILRFTDKNQPASSVSSTTNWAEGIWRKASGGSGARENIEISGSPCGATRGWRLALPDPTTTSSSYKYAEVSQDYVTPIVKGMTFTVSCYVKKVSGSGDFRIYGYNHSSSQVAIGMTIVQSDCLSTMEWMRVVCTGVGSSPVGVYFGIRGYQNFEVQMCGMQLEYGSKASEWKHSDWDVQNAFKEFDYLKNGLQEAREGTTSIEGGLVLSKIIGVKADNNDNASIVAGFNATSDALSGLTALLFAGRDANNPNGTFRVYKNGVVESVNPNDSSQVAQYDNSSLKFKNSDGIRNVISSEPSGGIDNMLRVAGAQGGEGTESIGKTTSTWTQNRVNEVVSTSTGSYSDPSKVSYNGVVVSNSSFSTSDEKELFTPSLDADATLGATKLTMSLGGSIYFGTSYFDDNNAGQTNSEGATISGISNNVKVTYTYSVWRAGILVAANSVTKSKTSSGSISTSDSALKAEINIPAVSYVASKNVAQKVKIVVSASVEISSSATTHNPGSYQEPDYSTDGYYDVYVYPRRYIETTAVYVQANLEEFEWSYGQIKHTNHIYADGLLMSESDDSYFALDPTATDGDLLRFRLGNALYRMLTGGLAWNLNGGSTFYPVSPLILAVQLTYANNGYTRSIKYNPKGVAVNIQKIDQGRITFTHNLGLSNYSIQGVATPSNRDGSAATFINVAYTECTADSCVLILYHDGRYDGSVMIYVYSFEI